MKKTDSAARGCSESSSIWCGDLESNLELNPPNLFVADESVLPITIVALCNRQINPFRDFVWENLSNETNL